MHSKLYNKLNSIFLFLMGSTLSTIQILYIKQIIRMCLSVLYNYAFFSKPILFYFFTNLFFFSQKFIFGLHLFSIWILFFVFLGILLLIPFSWVRLGFLISKGFFVILRLFFENSLEKGFFFLCITFFIIFLLKSIRFYFLNISTIIKNYFKLFFFFIMQFRILGFLILIEESGNGILAYIRFFYYFFFEYNLFATSTFCRPMDESINFNSILKNLYAIHEFHAEVSKELFLLGTFLYPAAEERTKNSDAESEALKKIVQQNEKYIVDIDKLFSKNSFSHYKTEQEIISNIKRLNIIYRKLYNNCRFLRKIVQNPNFIDLINTNNIFYKSVRIPNSNIIKSLPSFFDLRVIRKPFVVDLVIQERLNTVKNQLIQSPEALNNYTKILYRANELQQVITEYADLVKTQKGVSNIDEDSRKDDLELQQRLAGQFENVKQYISKFPEVGVVKNDPFFNNIKIATNNFQLENVVDLFKVFNKEPTASLQSCQASLEMELLRLKEQVLNIRAVGLDPEIQKKNIKIIEELSKKKLLIDNILTQRLKVAYKDINILEFPPNIFEKNTLQFSDIHNMNIDIVNNIQMPKKDINNTTCELLKIINDIVEYNKIRGHSVILKYKNDETFSGRQIYKTVVAEGLTLKTLYEEFYKNSQNILMLKTCPVNSILEFRRKQFQLFNKIVKITEGYRNFDNNNDLVHKIQIRKNQFYNLKFGKPIVNPSVNLKLPPFLTRTALQSSILAFNRQDLEFRLEITKNFDERLYLQQELIKMETLERSVRQQLHLQKKNFTFALYDIKLLNLEKLTPLQISQITLFSNLKYTLEVLNLKLNDVTISEGDRKRLSEDYTFLENNFKKLESRLGILKHPLFLNKVNLHIFNEKIKRINPPDYYKSFLEKLISQRILCSQFKSDILSTRKEIEEVRYRISLTEEKAAQPIRGKTQLEEKLAFLTKLYAKREVEYKNRVLEMNTLFRKRPLEIENLNPKIRLQDNILTLEKNIRMDVEKEVENFIMTICENKNIPNPRLYKTDNRFLEHRVEGLKLSHTMTCDNIRNLSNIERMTDDVKKKIKLEEIKLKIIRRELNITLDKLKQFKVILPDSNIKTPIISINSEPMDISPIGVPAITGTEFLKTPEQIRNPVIALRRDPQKVVDANEYSRIPVTRLSTFGVLLKELHGEKRMTSSEFKRVYPQFYHVAGNVMQAHYNAILNALVSVDARLITNELNVSRPERVNVQNLDLGLIAECAVRNGIPSELLIKAVKIRQKSNCPLPFIYENLDNIRIALRKQPFLQLPVKDTVRKLLYEGKDVEKKEDVNAKGTDIGLIAKIRISATFLFLVKTAYPILQNWFKN